MAIYHVKFIGDGSKSVHSTGIMKNAVDEAYRLHKETGKQFDPNAATKFDSKYQAKTRVRELEDVPATRCFKELVN